MPNRDLEFTGAVHSGIAVRYRLDSIHVINPAG